MSGTLWLFQHWTQLWVTNLLSGLIGAVLGSLISYRTTLVGAERATKTAFEVQQKEFLNRENATKAAYQALIRGTVQSISDEVEAICKHYNREIGPHLSALQPGQAANVFRANQNYFVIFDTAGALVGRIPDEALRSKIIDFYVAGKAFVDGLQHHEQLHVAHKATSDQNQKDDIWRQIVEYSQSLKAFDAEFRNLYSALRSELDRYLKTWKGQFQMTLLNRLSFSAARMIFSRFDGSQTRPLCFFCIPFRALLVPFGIPE
jgi:hypothetical protein